MICAVVLAAGRSQRMGTQKLLLDYGGRPLIVHIVEQLLAAELDGVYVVTGHDREAVRRALAGYDVSFVHNAGYEAGMLSSVRCGFEAVPEACGAVVFVLGDQPAITPGLVRGLVGAYEQTQKGIVVPVHDGRRGHPTLVAAKYRQDVLTRYDEVGLRGLLREHADDVFELPVGDLDVAFDMDSPEDYARYLRHHGDS